MNLVVSPSLAKQIMNTIDWSKSDAEILEWYSEVLVKKTGVKTKFSDIEERFPKSGYRTLVINSVAEAAKQDPEAQVVFYAASNDGTDLADEYAQDKVRNIATHFNWPDELTNWILGRAIVTLQRWQNLGLTTQPTLQSIAAERAARLAELEKQVRDQEFSAIREFWLSKYAAILSWISRQQSTGESAPDLDDIIEQLRK